MATFIQVSPFYNVVSIARRDKTSKSVKRSTADKK